MGAIVGALYACGYTPEEMMELITSDYFANISTGRIDPSLEYYFTRQPASPRMFAIPIGNRAKTSADTVFNPQSLINPMPMDFAFMEIFGAYTAQCGGNFDKLMVPFRCVASDVSARRAKVLDSGSLAASVHASMSFLSFFRPPESTETYYTTAASTTISGGCNAQGLCTRHSAGIRCGHSRQRRAEFISAPARTTGNRASDQRYSIQHRHARACGSLGLRTSGLSTSQSHIPQGL